MPADETHLPPVPSAAMLREARQYVYWTQTELARRLGISVARVRRLEHDDAYLPATRAAIVEALQRRYQRTPGAQ